MIIFPNAKINIGLRILRRRHDGYHDIETIMVPVDWHDILELVPGSSSDHTLTVSGRVVDCPAEKNLVMKAVRALEAVCSFPPTDFFLHKIIPDGAGLGGGSADAAFAVTGLNTLYNLGLSHEAMCDILSRVGADCPFFVYNRPMLATGTGTELQPIDVVLPGKTIVIVKPSGDSVNTALAYQGCQPDDKRVSFADEVASSSGDEWCQKATNDFEISVVRHIPAIRDIKHALSEMGARYVSMSGSGSAVFGLFNHDILSSEVAKKFAECDFHVGRLLV